MASDRGVRARKGWVHLMPGSEDTRQLWGADRSFAIAPGDHRVELMAEPPPRSN